MEPVASTDVGAQQFPMVEGLESVASTELGAQQILFEVGISCFYRNGSTADSRWESVASTGVGAQQIRGGIRMRAFVLKLLFCIRMQASWLLLPVAVVALRVGSFYCFCRFCRRWELFVAEAVAGGSCRRDVAVAGGGAVAMASSVAPP